MFTLGVAYKFTSFTSYACAIGVATLGQNVKGQKSKSRILARLSFKCGSLPVFDVHGCVAYHVGLYEPMPFHLKRN